MKVNDMKKEKYIKACSLLMIISAIFLVIAVVYCDLSKQVVNYKYVDADEYEDVRIGLDFLDKIPIHFNIINKYFSNMNNLHQQEKEEILLAYAIKNNYRLYECGPSNSVTKYLCINKKDLTSYTLLGKFNLNLDFKSDSIKIYVDDYGVYTITTNKDASYYKITLDNSTNNLYREYFKFDHYKKEKDSYLFYIYQGYFKGNCKKEEKLDLYDFMSGDVVYSGKCNGNHNFSIDPSDNVKKLQLYKYELKKDKYGNFYLYGYNPVNKM